MATYKMIYQHGHPLAVKGRILRSRFVLYEKIGPGRHQCHWCARSLRWSKGRHPGGGAITVDHLDSNPSNDHPDNLVPACMRCNMKRGCPNPIRDDELVIRSSTSHHRVTRAEQRQCLVCHQPFLHMIAKRGPRKGLFCSRACANRGRYIF